MKSEFLIALTQLAAERHLPREVVLSAIEAGLASAFKKENVTAGQNISVKLDPNTGDIRAYALKTVVEEVEDEQNEIDLAEALKIKADVAVGDSLPLETVPQIASRIAAQTARQVVMQRLREAERELVYEEFSQRVDELVSGVVDQLEPGRVLLELGRAQAVLAAEEQVPSERYRKGQRLRVYILDVQRSPKGPEIIVSRTHRDLLKRLFEMEVPEVYNGVVEIRAIAREPGSRSKVAVAARQDGVDPVGSCIGMRGNRIQNIVNELQGEKIDVVRWHKEVRVFIANALSPAEVAHVEMDEETKTATVVVPDRHLSLAIGREGQNARLAARLTGWRLDMKSATEWEELRLQRQVDEEAQRVAERQAVLGEEEPAALKVTEEVEVEVPEELEAPAVAVVEEPAEAVEVEVQPVEEEKVPTEVPTEVPAVSAEEELAALTLEEDEEEEEGEEEEVPLEVLSDELWKVPTAVPEAGLIRFAEDIMDDRGQRSGGRTGRRRSGSSRRGRGRRGGRGRSTSRR